MEVVQNVKNNSKVNVMFFQTSLPRRVNFIPSPLHPLLT